MNTISEKATDSTFTSLTPAAHRAIDRAAGAAKPAIENAAAAAHDAVERLANAAAPAANWLSRKGEGFVTTPKKVVDASSDYIVENPLKAVAIAVVAGALLARILL